MGDRSGKCATEDRGSASLHRLTRPIRPGVRLALSLGIVLIATASSKPVAVSATGRSSVGAPPHALGLDAWHSLPSRRWWAKRPTQPSPTTPPISTSTPSPTTLPPPVTPADPSPPAGSTTTAASSTIGVSGGHLTLNGSVYRFLGLDAYQLATQWGTNAGCGGMQTDGQLNDFFASLRPNSLVRFTASQGTIATNIHTGQLDWGPLDRVFAAAAAHGQRLIATLTDQAGTCDNGHWKDPAWYSGGFMSVFNDPSTTDGRGLTPLSYWDYVQAIVNRYKGSSALGMWEPVNEAEASTCPNGNQPTSCSGHQTCPDESVAATDLRHFFDLVGAEIHSLDPNHLIESGLLGGGQCGTQGGDYQYVSASPGVDVLSYHDYYGASATGGDQWNGLAVRFAQAAALGKPIIGGEMGIEAGDTGGCSIRLAQRSADIQAKIEAQLAKGSSGVLLWGWVPVTDIPCNYEIAPGDPVLSVLASIAL